MAEGIAGGDRAECRKVVGDGGLAQDWYPRLQDYQTPNCLSFVNGRQALSAEETLKVGSYNALLKSSASGGIQILQSRSRDVRVVARCLQVGVATGLCLGGTRGLLRPAVDSLYKFTHWGFFEGPFKGHAPTGELVEFLGMGTLKVDEAQKVEEVEIYYDSAEFFGGLLKGSSVASASACPFSR